MAGSGSKTVVIAGIVSGIALFIISSLGNMAVYPFYLESPSLWKPVNELWYVGIVLFYILAGLIFSLIYTVFMRTLKGRALGKGLLYGSLVWFIGPLQGVLFTHLTMAVDVAIIVSWLFNGLIGSLVAGVIIAHFFEGR